MAEIKGGTYAKDEIVDVDGKVFRNCRFEGTTLRYSGGKHPTFIDCDLIGAAWHFAGGALRTIQLLQQFLASDGGPEFIAGVFKPGLYFADE